MAATLAERLGIEALVDETVELGERAGAANAGAKVMTLISAMALGADCIDDCDVLRAGRTGAVLGHRVAAPSTLGHLPARVHLRARAPARPRARPRRSSEPGAPVPARATSGWSSTSTSFVGEVHGYAKQGAAYGYTRQRGYHPILASRAGTGEVLHVRLRKGSANTSRGALRFVDELIARVERAGASGPKLLRADSGFWNKTIFARLDASGLELLDRGAPAAHGSRRDRADPRARLADPGRLPADQRGADRRDDAGRPAAGRPPRPHLDRQGQLLPTWELYPFLTNRTDALEVVEAEHRQHAVVELVIRDLKDQALAHFPSGRFFANAAWTVIAALAHNLLRWTGVLGLPDRTVRVARTLRRRLLAIPGRLTRSARHWTLHLPARWPWQHDFIEALTRIRALPAS